MNSQLEQSRLGTADGAADSTTVATISVVIATHNAARALCRALDSVFAQTLPPAEVIVVDDGSTDDTTFRLAPYRDRIRFVRQVRAGRAIARNRAVELAREPWVAFLEADDVWAPAHLARMVAAIRATEGAARIYFGDVDRPAAEGGGSLWRAAEFTRAGDGASDGWMIVADGATWILCSMPPLALSAAVVARSAFLASGGLDRRVRRPLQAEHLFGRIAIGAPVCAVAGLSARVSGEIDASRPPRSERETLNYWRSSVRLYRDLLRKAGRGPHRSELRHRLATVLWRLARAQQRRGAWPCALFHVVRAAAIAPGVLGRTLVRLRQRRRAARSAGPSPGAAE